MEERPCCPYCGKKLRPDTSFVEVDGDRTVPPRSFPNNRPQFGDGSGYSPDRVYRRQRFLDKTWFHYWTGIYDAYSQLFCTYNCGVMFATAAFKAGYRMNRTCPHTGRD